MAYTKNDTAERTHNTTPTLRLALLLFARGSFWIRWTAELSGAWESEVGFRHLGLFRIGLFGWPGCCSLGAASGSDGLQSFPGPGNRKWGFAIWVYLGLDSSAGLAVVPLGLLLDPMDCRAFRGLGIGSGVSPFGFI